MESNYQKLKVWKKSFELTEKIYVLSKNFPKEELFGFVSQMRRCALSIPSNIAEGCGRNSKKEFSHFLGIARGSCNELENQILLCQKLKYINNQNGELLLNDCNEILKMLSTLIQKNSKL